MAWRRWTGAGVMLAGAVTLLAAVTQAVLLAAAGVHAGSDAIAILAAVGSGASMTLASGCLVLTVGRLAYGAWRTATPIATVTMDMAHTAGLLAATCLGGMAVFLTASGPKSADDAPAIIALALGAGLGLALARVSGGLRNA